MCLKPSILLTFDKTLENQKSIFFFIFILEIKDKTENGYKVISTWSLLWIPIYKSLNSLSPGYLRLWLYPGDTALTSHPSCSDKKLPLSSHFNRIGLMTGHSSWGVLGITSLHLQYMCTGAGWKSEFPTHGKFRYFINFWIELKI